MSIYALCTVHIPELPTSDTSESGIDPKPRYGHCKNALKSVPLQRVGGGDGGGKADDGLGPPTCETDSRVYIYLGSATAESVV